MQQLAQSSQPDLVIDIAEMYFIEYAKTFNLYDDYFFTMSKVAFETGKGERRIAFLNRVISMTQNKDISLATLLANTLEKEK